MTAVEQRPSATDLLAQIPESVANNEGEVRAWIRTVIAAFVCDA